MNMQAGRVRTAPAPAGESQHLAESRKLAQSQRVVMLVLTAALLWQRRV